MDLLSNEIHLYFTYPEQISDPALLHRYKTLLSDEELTQMPRFFSAMPSEDPIRPKPIIATFFMSRSIPDPILPSNKL